MSQAGAGVVGSLRVRLLGGLPCLAAALACSAPPAHGAVIDAPLVEDTYLSSGSTESSTAFAGDTVLRFRTHTSTWRNPLIQFDLPALSAGEEVVQVELILTSASDPTGTGGTPGIEVVGTATAIDLATLTYNTASGTLHNGGESFTSALAWTDIWTDFTGSDGLIPGADFAVGQAVTYTGSDPTQGLLKFVRDHIDASSSTTVTLGLGFVLREGNGGTTSAGWNLYSREGAGAAPVLRITTAPIPEPASLGLISAGGVLLLARKRGWRGGAGRAGFSQ